MPIMKYNQFYYSTFRLIKALYKYGKMSFDKGLMLYVIKWQGECLVYMSPRLSTVQKIIYHSFLTVTFMSIFFNYFLVGGHAALNKTVLGISWPQVKGCNEYVQKILYIRTGKMS